MIRPCYVLSGNRQRKRRVSGVWDWDWDWYQVSGTVVARYCFIVTAKVREPEEVGEENIYNYLEKKENSCKWLRISEENRSEANQKLKSRISKDIADFRRGARG